MMISLQSKAARSIMVIVCACALVWMLAMPVLRAAHTVAMFKTISSGQAAAFGVSKHAAGVPCHGGGPVADPVGAVHTETSKLHHHGHDNGHHVPGRDVATLLSIQDGTSDNELAANELFGCCVSGCGLAILAAGLGITVADSQLNRYALPANVGHAEFGPAMPTEPPRTTDIADLAA